MSDQPIDGESSSDEPPVQSPRLRRAGTFGRLTRLCAKELREILRDRRTIITLILMPLLVYPILSLTFNRFLTSSFRPTTQLQCVVGFENAADYLRFKQWYEYWSRQLEVEFTLESTDDEPTILWHENRDVLGSVREGTFDLGVVMKPVDAPRDPGPNIPRINFQLIHREKSPLSQEAKRFFERRLGAINEAYDQRVLGKRLPLQVQESQIAAEGGPAFSFATFVPLILILMTITGAVYPAIDLTAGERERGTMEALIAAPVPRFGLLIAKYIAVLTVALLTATANLLAMTITLYSSGLSQFLFGDEGLSWTVLSQVFSLLVLFAGFFSALLLVVTSFARSFKEAQAYLIPIMLLSLGPGVVSLLPGIELTPLVAVTPLLNIVLLARDAIQGTVDLQMAGIAVISTLIYALASIALAARIFGTDAILYGSHSSWSDLFRRPRETSSEPTVATALFCLAMLFPMQFLAASLVAQMGDVPLGGRLLLNALVTALLFVGVPLLVASWQRINMVSGFRLHAPRTLAFSASLPLAAVLGMSLWVFAHEIVLLGNTIGLGSLEDKLEIVERLVQEFRTVSPVIIVLAMALTPAVCEEFFFRGFLLQAILKQTSPLTAIIGSAVLFGAFHLIGANSLAVERFLPSTFLGLFLGWVCVRTGSVLPGMLLHLLHNGLLVMISYYRDELIKAGLGLEGQEHLPWSWIGAATVATVVVTALMWVVTKRKTQAGSTK